MPSKDPEVFRRASKKYRKRHPEKIRAANAKSYQADRVRAKRRAGNWHFQKRYGITLVQRDELLAAQGFRCKACGTTAAKQWEVDHNHSTGKIRGILCHPCNSAAGHSGDDPIRLRMIADYLEREDG